MDANYKYLFGPVPSRRLGMSLGVDLIPHKICSLNCVYCECGHTTKLTFERKEYVPTLDVFNELRDFFRNNPDPDYITFSGAGEPTLHSHIGEVLGFIKKMRPKVPLAVLTNGILFNDVLVRKELFQADLVLPSLDAATDSAFQRINRPVKDSDIDSYIQGLIDFCYEFEGETWIEVLILPGYNDDDKNINALKVALKKIGPHRIQLNSLDRPGAVNGLSSASQTQLERIAKLWNLENVEIIASVKKPQDVKSYRTDVESAILETISRRPCTMEDLGKIMGLHINEIKEYLGVLERSKRIECSILERGTFFRVRNS